MFIGTNREKIELMKVALPLYLKNGEWLEEIKSQYDAKEYNNIREVLVEAINLKYINNLEAVRTIKDGIYFNRINKDEKVELTKKGEKFLKNVWCLLIGDFNEGEKNTKFEPNFLVKGLIAMGTRVLANIDRYKRRKKRGVL